jgi:hypothetical protein
MDQRSTAQVVNARRAGRTLAKLGVVSATRTGRGGAVVHFEDNTRQHTDCMEARLTRTAFALADFHASL